MTRKRTVKIRSVILFFNSILIVLIISGGYAVTGRLNEAAMIRQTELILLSQGMVLSQVVLNEMKTALGDKLDDYGNPLTIEDYRPTLAQDKKGDLIQDPVQPRLDPVLDRPIALPDIWEREKAQPADELAVTIGHNIEPLLLAARESTLTGVRVVDWRGTVISSTSGGQGRSLSHWPEVSIALGGRLASRMYRRLIETQSDENPSVRRGYRIHVALPIVSDRRCLGAVILVREPLNLDLTGFSSFNHYVVLATVVLVLLVVLFSALTALTISSPISSLLSQVNRMAKGDKTSLYPLARPITREVDQLSSGFVRMAKSLDERSEYILTFARELSHAFKPSLATIQMRLEFIQDDRDQEESSPEERARHLSIIKQEASRMEQKTIRALEWAKADARQPTGQTAPVNRILNELAGRYRTQNADIHLDLDPRVMEANIPAEDLEKIVANLVDNAIQHGGPEVRIFLKTRRAGDGGVILEVADNGPGISEANQKKIFNTFFTTTPEKGGTGLGLPIVRSLLKAHQGDIRLDSRPDLATVFVVRLTRGD